MPVPASLVSVATGRAARRVNVTDSLMVRRSATARQHERQLPLLLDVFHNQSHNHMHMRVPCASSSQQRDLGENSEHEVTEAAPPRPAGSRSARQAQRQARRALTTSRAPG